MEHKEEILQRVVTFLNRQELDFLDKMAKDIFFTKGINIPRSTLIRTVIDLIAEEDTSAFNGHEKVLSKVMAKSEKGGKL